MHDTQRMLTRFESCIQKTGEDSGHQITKAGCGAPVAPRDRSASSGGCCIDTIYKSGHQVAYRVDKFDTLEPDVVRVVGNSRRGAGGGRWQ